MPRAIYQERTYNVPTENGYKTVYLRYILCNRNDVQLVNTGSASVRSSQNCGINGTFFNPYNGYMVGVCINDGLEVKPYGLVNRDSRSSDVGALNCGTYFALKNPINGIRGGSAKLHAIENFNYNGITLTVNNCQFAIGGTSLFPDRTFANADEYYAEIENTEDLSIHEDASSPRNERNRSAVVYIGGNYENDLNFVLLTVHGAVKSQNGNDYITYDDGVNLWQLRNLINDVFGAMLPSPSDHVVHAICLDGGGSTQIAYIDDNGIRKSYQTYETYQAGDRTICTMLKVPMGIE